MMTSPYASIGYTVTVNLNQLGYDLRSLGYPEETVQVILWALTPTGADSIHPNRAAS